MDFSLKLGGLMGASPYSNLSILDSQQQRRGMDQRHLLQLMQQTPPHQLMENVAPPVIKFHIPDRIVQDVMCRFVVNIPDEEKFDPVRALFQIELAHWFFIDHYCGDEGDPEVSKLGHIPFSQFAYIMFKGTPHLCKFFPQVDRYLSEFRAYRSRVPTFGAILMNSHLTQVLLVQGFRNQWGFPKGKVNEVEDPVECAIREVFEETGYDMRPLINPNHYIESKTRERNDRLYLVRGVDSNFPFYPQTQYEIKSICWFNIDELPEHKKDTNPSIFKHGQPITNFFTIYPYIKRLKVWVTDKLEGKNKIECFRSRWFDSDKEEEENFMQFPLQAYGSSLAATGSYNYTATMQFLYPGSTPGQDIMTSLQRGLPNPNDPRHNVNSAEATQKLKENPLGKKTPKGSKSKKRLFVEAAETVNVSNIKTETPPLTQLTKTELAGQIPKQPVSTQAKTNRSQQRKSSIADNITSASSWQNFKLDKDRITRALKGETL